MSQLSLDSPLTRCACPAIFAHSTSCAVLPRECRVPGVARALCHAVAALGRVRVRVAHSACDTSGLCFVLARHTGGAQLAIRPGVPRVARALCHALGRVRVRVAQSACDTSGLCFVLAGHTGGAQLAIRPDVPRVARAGFCDDTANPRVGAKRAIRAREGPQARLVCALRTQRARRAAIGARAPCDALAVELRGGTLAT